jgi:hypothetical protein
VPDRRIPIKLRPGSLTRSRKRHVLAPLIDEVCTRLTPREGKMNLNLSDSWGRYRALLVVAGLVLIVSLLTRLGLVWFEGEAANFGIARLSEILAVGLIYDLSALARC